MPQLKFPNIDQALEIAIQDFMSFLYDSLVFVFSLSVSFVCMLASLMVAKWLQCSRPHICILYHAKQQKSFVSAFLDGILRFILVCLTQVLCQDTQSQSQWSERWSGLAQVIGYSPEFRHETGFLIMMCIPKQKLGHTGCPLQPGPGEGCQRGEPGVETLSTLKVLHVEPNG